MAKIVIFDLSASVHTTFLDDLDLCQIDTLLGGSLESTLDNYTTILVTAFQDGVNTLAQADPVVNLGNNKLFTVDFSGLTINVGRLR